jgi:hypothetical protein
MPPKSARHGNLYAHHLWRQQRFFAGFLVLIGLAMTALLIFQHQLFRSSNVVWLLYIPSGLLLGGAFLYYRWRSHVEPMEDGLKVSTMFRHVMIDYDSIRNVRVQELSAHFQDQRKRMVAPMMKQLIDKPALFIRLRADEEQLAAIKKSIGARLMYEDTIAIPVKDPDAAAWAITSHLPERIGQNLGGGKRRKRRR